MGEQNENEAVAVEPVSFIADLERAFGGKGYSKTDRYRDFRAVFLGSAQGQRVLAQILRMCHVNLISFDMKMPRPAEQVAYLEGERSIGLQILQVIGQEPQQVPTKAQTRRDPAGG